MLEVGETNTISISIIHIEPRGTRSVFIAGVPISVPLQLRV